MNFFRRYRFALLVAALLVGSLGFFSYNSSKEHSGTFLSRAFLEVLGPVQEGVTSVGDWIDRIWSHYFYLVQAARENEELQGRVSEMRQDLADLEELKQENNRLRRLLTLKEKISFPVVAAEVVGADPTSQFRTMVINKGSAGGVESVMPVMAAEGVVGRIIWSGPHFAKALLLTDPNSGVDVLVQRSRARGVVEGAGDGKLRLKYVLHTDDVVVGDNLVTSGAAGVYPKGLLVGRVTSVFQEGRGVFLRVEAEPVVDFNRLEDVLVILRRSDVLK